jgi:tetraacyldisaccharide 4'-kinase
LQAELQSGHSMISMLNYPDHHEFTRRDMDKIEERLKEMPSGTVIVTTAKDAARLSGMELKPELACRIFILPVTVRFLRHAERFNQQILQHVQSFKKQ